MSEVQSKLKLNLVEEVKQEAERIDSMEKALGFGLVMPFNNTNASQRKLLHAVQRQHALQTPYGKPPLISTGYENKLGEYSSTFIKTKSNYEVIAKISKFSFAPDHHYFLVLKNLNDNSYDIIERISYDYYTEEYGILYDNEFMDSLTPKLVIPEGSVIKKSKSYDKHNNRIDGIDLMSTYMSLESTKEDAIIISEVAAKLLSAPLIKKLSIVINSNDIPLNLLGNENVYKSFPNVGEEVQHGIVCAIRRRKKDESLFSESYYRLRQLMMSDEKYHANGKVIDINLYCNDPDSFGNFTDAQLKFYYDETVRFTNEIVQTLEPIMNSGSKVSYDLQKMYYIQKKLSEGGEFIKEKRFSNILLEMYVLEMRPVEEGDKLSNRYGGKGCVSEVRPVSQMPRLDNGQYVHLIYNSSGVYNRQNAGQLFELSINHIGQRILDYSEALPISNSIYAYKTFLHEVCPEYYNGVSDYIDNLEEEDIDFFMDSLLEDEGINIAIKPISESLTIDDLNRIYRKMEEIGFPIKPYKVTVPQEDSNGNIRYVETRRTLICGKQYIYRLKQYAEEKFSVTSLSSVNIKNENSKNSNKKYYKSLYSQTPIQFGTMESGNLAHIGIEKVIINLMLNSLSPHGRRLAETLWVDNPFDINIKIDDEAKNRGVEVFNTYLMVMGLGLRFIKKPKKKQNLLYRPLLYKQTNTYSDTLRPLLYKPHEKENPDLERYLNEIEEKAKSLKPLLYRDLLYKIEDTIQGGKKNKNENISDSE